MGENPPWKNNKKVYRVLDIRGINSKLWMVQFLDIDKAFIKFLSACEKIENWWNDIDFREKIPHEIPHGGKSPMEIPHGACTGFSISQNVTQKCGWCVF
jgi:hypothetical protein